jgi:urea transport system permease protein
VVNWAKTFFSESFPQLWLFLMGGLFIAVVMFFPNGLAGILEQHARRVDSLKKRLRVLVGRDAASAEAGG